MATMNEYVAAIAARADVISVSTPFPPNGEYVNAQGQIDQTLIDRADAVRKAIGAPVRRRVLVVRTDALDGRRREYTEDFGVHDIGGAGETVVEIGAGPGTEPPNPEDVFRAQAETWISNNVATVDANIIKWWITSVDEDRKIARVMTIYDDGQGGYIDKPFTAVHLGGANVAMKPDTTVR